MEAALEAANPAKTSRLEIVVIPFLCLLGSHSLETVARDRVASHFTSRGLICIRDRSIAIQQRKMLLGLAPEPFRLGNGLRHFAGAAIKMEQAKMHGPAGRIFRLRI